MCVLFLSLFALSLLLSCALKQPKSVFFPSRLSIRPCSSSWRPSRGSAGRLWAEPPIPPPYPLPLPLPSCRRPLTSLSSCTCPAHMPCVVCEGLPCPALPCPGYQMQCDPPGPTLTPRPAPPRPGGLKGSTPPVGLDQAMVHISKGPLVCPGEKNRVKRRCHYRQ